MNTGVRIEKLGNPHRILGVALHAHREGLKPEVGIKRRLCGRINAEVTRKLYPCFRNVGRASE